MADRFELESTGKPELADLERNFQRALTRVQQRTQSLGTAAEGFTGNDYTAADAADWDGTAPTTITAALDRIAAHIAASALGPIPV